MPCRQGDCLRGYRKWGEWGKGMGTEEGEGWHSQGTTLHPPAQNLILKQPLSLPPPAAYTRPPPVRFLFFLVLICPSSPSLSPPKPFSLLAPSPPCPSPLVQGFYNEQDCKLQPGVWEKKHPRLPPNNFYSLPDSMMSPPSSSSPLCWRWREGWDEIGEGWGRSGGGRVSKAFLHLHTPV